MVSTKIWWLTFILIILIGYLEVSTSSKERDRRRCNSRNKTPQPCNELYIVDDDGCCKACKCRRGRGRPRNVKDPCSERCERCEIGKTYNNKYDFFCKPCEGCYENRIVEQECTRRRNRKCGEGCIPGYYRRKAYNQELDKDCVPCTIDTMNIPVCTHYFNTPLNKTTTKSPTTVKIGPFISTPGVEHTYISSSSSAEVVKTPVLYVNVVQETDPRTTSAEFNTTSPAAVEMETSEQLNVEWDPAIMANDSGNWNSTINANHKNEIAMKQLHKIYEYIKPYLVASVMLATGPASSSVVTIVVLSLCWLVKRKTPCYLFRKLFRPTELRTRRCRTAVDVSPDNEKVIGERAIELQRTDSEIVSVDDVRLPQNHFIQLTAFTAEEGNNYPL